MPLTLRNFILSQVGWFACAFGAAYGYQWTGPLVTVGVVAVHLYSAPRAAPEVTLLVITMALGFVVDAPMAFFNLVTYPTPGMFGVLQPYWMLALWALFATMLNVTLRWLKTRMVLAAVLGAILGPIAYWSGQRLGALTLAQFWPAVYALAVGWGAVMPLLMWLSNRYDGYHLPIAQPKLA
jgi:hypothetical protein